MCVCVCGGGAELGKNFGIQLLLSENVRMTAVKFALFLGFFNNMGRSPSYSLNAYHVLGTLNVGADKMSRGAAGGGVVCPSSQL